MENAELLTWVLGGVVTVVLTLSGAVKVLWTKGERYAAATERRLEECEKDRATLTKRVTVLETTIGLREE